MIRFCEWMKETFRYEEGQQSFSEQVLQAIVAHVYLAMIHPFGDGNGRTARLIEFYILLRAGLPDIASHILSNHYNDTRQEYYRQLDLCVRERDLSGFIRYAVLGFRDGLKSVLDIVQRNLLESRGISSSMTPSTARRPRARRAPSSSGAEPLPCSSPWTNGIRPTNSSSVPASWQRNMPVSPRQRSCGTWRNFEELELIVKDKNKYKGNIEIMRGLMPLRKKK